MSQRNYEGYHIAVKRIQDCRRNNSTYLDLGDLGLEWLPEELNDLTSVKTLNCYNNRFTTIAGIKNLTSLTELDCGYNGLTNLAEVKALKALIDLDISGNQLTCLADIKNLSNLKRLRCGGNPLTSLAGIEALTALTALSCTYSQLTSLEEIRGLTSLELLSCGDNRLTSLAGVEGLKALTSLHCGDNQLTSLAEIKDLKALTDLHCYNNQITSLAGIEDLKAMTELLCFDNRLTSLDEVQNLTRLTIFECDKNPVHKVPPAFLSDITGLRAWWQDIRQSGAEPNTHSKLLLLGNGRVGKTTLCETLVEDAPQTDKPTFTSTEGICLKHWSLPDVGEFGWEVSIWDFGGQEIYHSTHRLFQSQEGVYCVLWAEGSDEPDEEVQHTLRYWLDLVTENNTDCPVIVVKNKTDRSDKDGLNNEALTDERYRNLPHYAVSALYNSRTGPLRAEIFEQMKALGTLNVELPKSWLQVRVKLSNITQRAISRTEFDDLCETGIHADTLLRYLHQCGDVFYLPEYFEGQVFLDQNWVLTAVYRLFTGKEVSNPKNRIEYQKGRVTGADLLNIYQDYQPDEVKLFVDFMLQNQMMFRLSGDDNDFTSCVWVLPGLLPKKPVLPPQATESANYQYQMVFPWLHRLAIERLLIACHALSSEDHWWRNGLILYLEDLTACYLVANPATRTLSLAFWGGKSAIESFLPRILRTIEKTRLSAPVKDRLKIGGQSWLEQDAAYRYVIEQHAFSGEHQQRKGALAYFYLQRNEEKDVRSIAPSKTKYITSIFAETLNMATHNTHNNIYNSPGAVQVGRDITGTVTTNINIGQTTQEKKQQIDEINSLLQLLKSSGLNQEDTEDFGRHLKNVKDELMETTPDTPQIEKQLTRFSGLLDKLEKGQELYTRAVAWLAGFGIVI